MIWRYPLSELRPNNWYLNEEKVHRIREVWRKGEQAHLPPISILRIDDAWALIDGHSRAWVAHEQGAFDIQAEILNAISPGERKLYEYIHHKGWFEGVQRIQDLSERILSPADYEERWIHYCRSQA